MSVNGDDVVYFDGTVNVVENTVITCVIASVAVTGVAVLVVKSLNVPCVAVMVAGIPTPVGDISVTTRWFVGTDTLIYEIVPGKFSEVKFRQPPNVTGPLPIGFPPVLNDPVWVAPDDTVCNVIVITDEGVLVCATVRRYAVFKATDIVAGSLVVFNQLQ